MQSLVSYDPLDEATLADPYPVLARLRDESPVFWHQGMGCWCLTRYADCVAVLRDHERFARDQRRAGTRVPAAGLSVQSLDPPEQSAVRSLFTSAVRAQDLGGIEHRAARRLEAIISGLAGRAGFDVMTEIAAPLSIAVICDVLGVDEPDAGSFTAASDAIMRSMDAGLDPATREAGRQGRAELTALVEAWFAASGRPGVLSPARAHAAGLPAGTGECVRNTARVMFQGGYSTMTAAIGNAVRVLLDEPSALEQMRDPAVLRTGAEELIRYDGPVQGTSRVALVTSRIGGVTVQAGDIVLALLAAANHDPAQFPDPGRLALDRWPNQHLGYGWGTHSCIGAPPARAVLRALIRVLRDQPALMRAAGMPRRRRTATMRAFDSLPATFRP
jgi:cytochrome P450